MSTIVCFVLTVWVSCIIKFVPHIFLRLNEKLNNIISLWIPENSNTKIHTRKCGQKVHFYTGVLNCLVILLIYSISLCANVQVTLNESRLICSAHSFVFLGGYLPGQSYSNSTELLLVLIHWTPSYKPKNCMSRYFGCICVGSNGCHAVSKYILLYY